MTGISPEASPSVWLLRNWTGSFTRPCTGCASKRFRSMKSAGGKRDAHCGSFVESQPSAAHRRGLVAFTDLVADIIDSGQRRGEVPESVRPQSAAAVLVAVVDGRTPQGIVEESTDVNGILDDALTAVLR